MLFLSEDAKRRVLDYVKPLAAGIDGVTNFGDVERMLRAAAAIAQGRSEGDAGRLFLLAVFAGREKWVEKFGNGSRTELFLSSVGVPGEEFRLLRRSLSRYASAPVSAEEECVHDARRLEELGAYGVVRAAAEGTRERLDLAELAAEIESAARDDLRTDVGRSLAAPRLALMHEFAKRLREEVAEFG
jgi:hypothetical protein